MANSALVVAIFLCAGLPAAVAERRQQSLDLDHHTGEHHVSEMVETNASSNLSLARDYFVFVKRINIQIPGGIDIPLAYHTETMFCPAPKDVNTAEMVKDNLYDKIITGFPELTEEEEKIYGGFLTEKCLVTGFAGLGPATLEFSSPKMKFFYGPYGNQILFYEGHVKLDVYEHVRNMKKCGNWEHKFYSLFYHNCNYYTKALMKSLGFDSPTFQSEKALGRAWLPNPGYYSVSEGKCMGMKCTAPGTDPENPRTGVCDKGTCYDGSEYLPKSRNCKSQVGKGLFHKLTGGLFASDEEEEDNSRQSKLFDSYWSYSE